MIAAGIGCRRGTPVDEIEQALTLAQDTFGVPGADIAVLATVSFKAEEPSLRILALRRGLPLRSYSKEHLESVMGEVMSPSERVRRLAGLASVAEASALIAAGRNARLLGARIATATVTCALAEGDGPLQEQEEQP